MSSLQLLDSRLRSNVDAQLSELDAALEQELQQSAQVSERLGDVVFRSRYRPQTFASVEELVARDIEAFSWRRTRLG